MKKKLIISIIFLTELFYVFSVVQKWNFENSSRDLFASQETDTFTVYEKTKDNLYVILTRKISRQSGVISITKNLIVKYNNQEVYNGEVEFDNIENFYRVAVDNDNVICPKGKYHPTYFYDHKNSINDLSNTFHFESNEDWDLSCYYDSSSKFFYVFYFTNGNPNIFYKEPTDKEWKQLNSESELYGFKFSSDGLSMVYLAKEGSRIKLKGNIMSYESKEVKRNSRGEITLREAKTYTRGCFENDYDHFYYLTYSDASNFACGYYDEVNTLEYLNVEKYDNKVNKFEASPLEFVDQVEIQEMRFVNNYKFVYYIIYNPIDGKTYHGIIDIKKNKVVFNTDKEILTFIPYSDISMLAITSTTAYEICAIKEDGSCKDSYGCTGENYNKYYLDTEGNKCGTSTSCGEGKIYLLREEMCSDSCDTSIYVLNENNNQCGLCSQIYPEKPYKLINTTQCLSNEEFPEGAEIYNTNLNLLKCKSGYKLEGETCVVDCGDQCPSPTTVTIPPTTITIPPTTINTPPTTVTIPPTTVTIPPTTINTPPTTVTIPPTTITIPPTTITIQPTTQELEQTTIIERPTTEMIPPTTVIQPPTTVEKELTTVIIPPTTTIEPPTTEVIPPTTLMQSPTTVITPSTTIIQPPTTTITPPTTELKPETTVITPLTTLITTIPEVKVKCSLEKCLECNDESISNNLCLTCNEALGYKKVNYTLVLTKFVDCLKKEDPKLKKFYYNETKNEYRPCYKTCKKCLIGGNPEVQNCLECETNYMFRPGDNPYNNCVAYSEYYYINSYNQYKPLKSLNCPEEAKYLVEEKNYCIYDCTKDKEYKYLYNGQCWKNCPSNTKNNSFICTENPKQSYLATTKLHSNANLTDVNNYVQTYISEFSYTSNHATLSSNEFFNILIYRNPGIINDFSLKMSKVDFQDCYDKVKNAYGIEEDLVITVVGTKNTHNPSSSYAFFHPKSGIKLDAENICKDEVIVVKENLTSILNENDTKYELQSSLTGQGINIFDVNDPFYTDLCFDYKNPKKRDIPLSDRIKNVFPNVTLCNDGCQMNGINLENMTATCNCKFNDITNNEIIKDNAVLDSMVGEIFDLINSSNIFVVKCYNYIFKYFKNSIGGILTTSIIALNLVLTYIFFAKQFFRISEYIKILMYRYLTYLTIPYQNAPPKRISKIEFKREKTKKNSKRKKSLQIPRKKEIEDSIDDKNLSTNEEMGKKYVGNPRGKNKRNKKKSKTHKINNKFLKSNKNRYSLELTNNYMDENAMIKRFVEEYLETSPDEMEYDDAIKKDDRTFCEYFQENLKEKQIIANTFIAVDPIKSRAIKIILFNLNLILYFVINGLFISEDYISELYYLNEEDENFFSFLPRSVERLIYTTLVSLIIGYITSFFFLEEKKVKGIFKRDMDNRTILRENINELIQTLKTRYIAFIIVVFVILILSLYYLLCFNYVYPKTQIEWIKSSIAIIIVIQILSILKILLEAILRFLSFKCESEKLFQFGKIFS